MKTPRETLLRKHAAANERLDQIRSGVVSDLARQHRSRTDEPQRQGWAGWAELLWPVRGHLAALAGAWVLIALLNLQTTNDQPVLVTVGHSSPPPAELLLIARENRLQVRELLGATDTASAEPAAPAPRRRSHSQPGAMWPVAPNAKC
jgi:hypothetical protein